MEFLPNIVGEKFASFTEILSHTFLTKNSWKAKFLLKKLLKSWFHEKFLGEREFLVFPHCTVLWYDHAQKISWNQLFSNFFSSACWFDRKIDDFLKSWSRIIVFQTLRTCTVPIIKNINCFHEVLSKWEYDICVSTLPRVKFLGCRDPR